MDVFWHQCRQELLKQVGILRATLMYIKPKLDVSKNTE